MIFDRFWAGRASNMDKGERSESLQVRAVEAAFRQMIGNAKLCSSNCASTREDRWPPREASPWLRPCPSYFRTFGNGCE
jgi:hypothetical protein